MVEKMFSQKIMQKVSKALCRQEYTKTGVKAFSKASIECLGQG